MPSTVVLAITAWSF